MFHLIYLFQVSLLIFSIQNREVDAEVSDLFRKVNKFFNNYAVSFSKIVSKFDTSAFGFGPIFSSYSKNVKSLVSTVDKMVSNVYSNVNIYDFITNLRADNSLWNWSVEYHGYPCSRFNVTAFDLRVRHEVFGQHIVHRSLSKLLENHFNTDKSKKSLILSFHGPTGCGKTFVSKIIVDSLFQEGIHSKFVHVYHGSLDFSHEKNKESYRERLQRDVIIYSHLCDRCIFIFDEVDDMVPGVIDALIPYITFYENSTIDSTGNIFLFLSNSGSNEIEQIMYDTWLKGISREDVSLEDFSSLLKEAAYNDLGGLQHSEIVNKNFIDGFIPFLPLEKEHVKQCVVKDLILKEKPIKHDTVEKISNQLEYRPPEFNLFSVSGCKRVANKVDIYNDST